MNRAWKQICLSCLALVWAASAGSAHAQVILWIDLTTANEVWVGSSGAPSAVDRNGLGDLDNIYFADFYAGADNPDASAFGTRLDFANDGTSLTTIDPNLGIEPAADYAVFVRSGGNDPGMGLSDWTTYSSIDFFTDEPAFVGASTWSVDPAYYAPMLAGENRGGDVYFPAINQSDIASSVVIGQYKVYVDLAKAGDVDGNGAIGFPDLNLLLGNYNGPDAGQTLASGDLDGDGDVGFSDLNILLGNYGYVGPSYVAPSLNAVPEPGSLALLGMGGLLVLRRRRG